MEDRLGNQSVRGSTKVSCDLSRRSNINPLNTLLGAASFFSPTHISKITLKRFLRRTSRNFLTPFFVLPERVDRHDGLNLQCAYHSCTGTLPFTSFVVLHGEPG